MSVLYALLIAFLLWALIFVIAFFVGAPDLVITILVALAMGTPGTIIFVALIQGWE